MTKPELKKFLQIKIDEKANIILNEHVRYDDAAFGELKIYSCLRRILNKTATLEDLGVLHAVSNLLQATGVLSSDESLASKIDK
ncbi:hypothetical protein ACQZ2F_24255 [Pseudomonas lurida]|jgi:hypothetical protein|uniref:hypothetical protein n=1 Tax=Pseudomonas lurida TaxID=244566 RepID=UPI00083D3802|nr:hypothetical protein [Pseudomonas lurida]AOE78612.1 hypothetical protein A7318_08420 [Pseudomonas lurida]VVN09347.1 hypothetical protein PS663_03749 [Pseudomonas fluorescens]